MISLHNILSIAKYERKTLLRSWFFRIFGILSLVVLFGMNFAMVIQGGGADGWAIRSIPSAIPYFNLLILNVAQAIIAVFLASDFLNPKPTRIIKMMPSTMPKGTFAASKAAASP